MSTNDLPQDEIVLHTRIPEQRAVEGLEYGARISKSGWTGYYVRPAGAVVWGIARQTPAADELLDSDQATLDAIREELDEAEAARLRMLPYETRQAIRLLKADHEALEDARRFPDSGNTIAGAMLAQPIGTIGSRQVAERAVHEAVRILDDGLQALTVERAGEGCCHE